MKVLCIFSLLLSASASAFACEYQDGTKFTGMQCEFHCTPGGKLLKTEMMCEGMTADPYTDPLYLAMQAACKGDPEDSNCYTIP